ncbi:MAG: GNAT family N-acetyltransferase [Methanomassiliicoccales archaeon]
MFRDAVVVADAEHGSEADAVSPLHLLRRKELIVRPMLPEDIEDLRFVGQEAWSDLASRDIGRKVKYPMRPRQVIEGYMQKEPMGCLVAEKEGKIIGAAYSHVWGTVGWVGPFEVLPEHQNVGVGSSLLEECERFLSRRGAKLIGLETMSHIPKNLHFYLSHGYAPTALTIITDKVLDAQDACMPTNQIETGGVREVGVGDREEVSRALKRIGDSIHPGLDCSSEFDILVEKGLGVVFVWEDKGRLDGVALLHTYQKSDDASYSSIRLLVVDPRSERASSGFLALLRSCEDRSYSVGKRRMYARFPVNCGDLYSTMMRRSYLIKGANIRFVKGSEYIEKGVYNLTSWAG